MYLRTITSCIGQSNPVCTFVGEQLADFTTGCVQLHFHLLHEA